MNNIYWIRWGGLVKGFGSVGMLVDDERFIVSVLYFDFFDVMYFVVS